MPREHERALADFEDKLVIDMQPNSFQPRSVCEYFPTMRRPKSTRRSPAAATRVFAAEPPGRSGWPRLLAPESRDARGIGSTKQLIRYLRDLPAAERTAPTTTC